jgi:hypothetical protein
MCGGVDDIIFIFLLFFIISFDLLLFITNLFYFYQYQFILFYYILLNLF